ncbi:MAG: hypothetical protein EPN88_06395 [Bacteroidetes bacterium]|nr:MAG: hypothetical protein EPN88_06395 [Bacteroidota bacterium]
MTRQLQNHLPGLAKIAPWRLTRQYNSPAKEVGKVTGRVMPPPLSAHTSGPLAAIIWTST